MKKVVILFVAMTMLVKPLWPVAEYIMNYNYIVNVLCENKERPELKCDGKCYLAKQFAKESKENEKNPFGEKSPTLDILHAVFFKKISNIFLELESLQNTQHNFSNALIFISSLHVPDISEPPELV
ncbi:hypothetical protein [Maribacter aurantiacus]|uniref:Uncharacterized protein n=1 Tax=Maribacter aurantiacus TaxID=1882343 RepID=A0A5R8MBT8_9FLAO|nr:hypothetical protein [Maribacter aurantiacus]TLF46239.1 hypothetical protein FEK29_00225 [Maribacter aurantiacus]